MKNFFLLLIVFIGVYAIFYCIYKRLPKSWFPIRALTEEEIKGFSEQVKNEQTGNEMIQLPEIEQIYSPGKPNVMPIQDQSKPGRRVVN